MSMDLDVKLTKNTTIAQLISDSKRELQKITNVNDIPDISVSLWEKGVKLPVDKDDFLKPGDTFIIKFTELEEEISLTMTEVKLLPPYIDAEEAGIWAGVSVQGEEKVKYLLAAGVALFLSYNCDSVIIDESLYWNNKRISDYDSFYNSRKLNTTSLGKEKADNSFTNLCDLFYESLPKGD